MSQSKQSPLRVGILGAGLMGRWHSEYALRAGARIVAVADQDISSASSLSARVSAQSYSDLADMLEKSGLDVLHICTPLASHYPLAMQAIRAGVHVFIEKPLAESAVQTRLLLSEAEKLGVSVCPVHQFGFQEGVRNTLSGHEDDVLQARFTVCSAGGVGQSDSALDQIVADILPHPLSVMRVIWPGISLSTEDWSVLHPRAGELYINAVAGGFGLTMYISMNARPTRCEMDIFGKQGRTHINFFHGYAVSEQGDVSRRKKIFQPFQYASKELYAAGTNIARRGIRREPAYPGLSRLIKSFYTAIATGSEGPIPAVDIIAVADARDELIATALPSVANSIHSKEAVT